MPLCWGLPARPAYLMYPFTLLKVVAANRLRPLRDLHKQFDRVPTSKSEASAHPQIYQPVCYDNLPENPQTLSILQKAI